MTNEAEADTYLLNLWDGTVVSKSVLTAQGEGVYTHPMQPTVTGTYLYTMQHKQTGQSIKGSPFVMTVLPAAVDPQKCLITGTGADIGVIQQWLNFTIHTMDRFNNLQVRFMT